MKNLAALTFAIALAAPALAFAQAQPPTRAELARVDRILRATPLIDGHNDLAEQIYYRCLDAGLSFKISQGCVLTLSPPLVISCQELDRALDIVEDAIQAVTPA